MVSRRRFWFLLIFVIAVQALPFVVALTRGVDGLVFGGFVLNPVDGNSYLAKMQLGWMGDWTFRLLYTAESGAEALLFLFYISLGHVARVSDVSVVVVFHVARLIASLGLFFAVARFFGRVFRGQQRIIDRAFVLAMVGGGLGALVLFGGYLPADVWVAEGYPYLSMLLNPHFPIGLALILWLVQPDEGTALGRKPWLRLGLGLLVSVIQPFGVVIVAVVLGVEMVWTWLEEKKVRLGRLLWSMGLGGPWLLAQFWMIRSNPVLAQWDAQNLTPAPPLWDLLLSLSPALILAVAGGVMLWNTRNIPGRRVLLGWAVVGLLLIYLPFSLQRRFMTGIYVPMVGLAVLGVEAILARRPGWKWLWPSVVGGSVLTNLLMLLITTAGVMGPDTGKLYMTVEERDALVWLGETAPEGAVVLASPELSMFVPAQTGRRVVYGHPFETVNAEDKENQVIRFFSGEMGSDLGRSFIEQNHVGYIVLGPRERLLGMPTGLDKYPLGYDDGGVTIYVVRP